VIQIDGQPWFVAADVCRTLGLVGWASTYTARLDSVEKRVIKKSEVYSSELETSFGLKQPSLTLVTESGLYTLTLRSDKPEAKAFKNWITRDVLPAIRKDGMYVAGEEKLKTDEQWSEGT
jgi:prophage antirepressor-like protein